MTAREARQLVLDSDGERRVQRARLEEALRHQAMVEVQRRAERVNRGVTLLAERLAGAIARGARDGHYHLREPLPESTGADAEESDIASAVVLQLQDDGFQAHVSREGFAYHMNINWKHESAGHHAAPAESALAEAEERLDRHCRGLDDRMTRLYGKNH